MGHHHNSSQVDSGCACCSLGHSEGSLDTFQLQPGGAWLAQSVGRATLDLRVV